MPAFVFNMDLAFNRTPNRWALAGCATNRTKITGDKREEKRRGEKRRGARGEESSGEKEDGGEERGEDRTAEEMISQHKRGHGRKEEWRTGQTISPLGMKT